MAEKYRVKHVILSDNEDDGREIVAEGPTIEYDRPPILPERGETMVVRGADGIHTGYVIARVYEQYVATQADRLNITVYAQAWSEGGGWPALCE